VPDEFSLRSLAEVVKARAADNNVGADAKASYTRQLLDEGVAACARKLGEEAVETVIAAMQEDREGLRAEAADLVYHLVVLLEARGIGFDEVVAELERRSGQSGLEEKAARARQPE
jgi:phosphoribosyl-ATP pyrophosphohydrolase